MICTCITVWKNLLKSHYFLCNRHAQISHFFLSVLCYDNLEQRNTPCIAKTGYESNFELFVKLVFLSCPRIIVSSWIINGGWSRCKELPTHVLLDWSQENVPASPFDSLTIKVIYAHSSSMGTHITLHQNEIVTDCPRKRFHNRDLEFHLDT